MRPLPFALCLLFATGCLTVPVRKTAIGAAIKGEGGRHDTFEATLRVLDENPAYVDEFFEMAMQHPKTLDRFIDRTAERLKDPTLAKTTAAALAKNPESLKRILVETLSASADKQEALQAIADAIAQTPSLAADALASRPSSIDGVTQALIDKVAKNPEAQAAMLKALGAKKVELAAGLATDHATLKALVGELIKRSATDEKLATALVRETVSGLDGPVLSKVTAEELTRQPEVMVAVLTSTLDAAAQKPEAQAAIGRAIGQRPEESARAIARDPEALRKTMIAAIDAVAADAPGRKALLAAVKEKSADLTRLLATDPEAVKKLMADFAREGAGDPSLLRKLLPKIGK